MRLLGLVADLLSYLALGWYVVIWSICLFGLVRARAMFLHDDDDANDADLYDDDASLPSISILRPLSGLDSGSLARNLASTFRLDYPPEKYEVIFSVAKEDDEALQVARRVVAAEAPRARCHARIIVGDVAAGVNPKVNNLLRSYVAAKHDVLWVLDSQVKLHPLALRRSVRYFKEGAVAPRPSPQWMKRRPNGSRVGLVHHVPLGVLPQDQDDDEEEEPAWPSHKPHRRTQARAWGSLVERAFLGTTHAKMYIAINSLAVESCVMGKSNLWRRSDLQRVPDGFFAVGEDGAREGDGEGALGSEAFRLAYGGYEEEHVVHQREEDDAELPPITDASTRARILRLSRPLGRFSIYLAEDNMLAVSLWKPPLSLSHHLAPSPACVARTDVSDVRTLRDYVGRRCRWIRVRRYMVPAATYVEPLTESVVAGVLALIAARWSGWSVVDGMWASIAALLLHFALWFAVDLGVLQALESGSRYEEQGAHDDDNEDREADYERLAHGQRRSLTSRPRSRRPLFATSSERNAFALAWLLREGLALPIWCWAIWGGNVVRWRGKPYRILSDSRAAQLAGR